MSEKKINLNFFQFAPTENPDNDFEKYKASFQGIQEAIKTLTSSNSFHSISRPDGRIELYRQAKKTKSGLIFGTLFNNQMSDIPPSFDSETGKLSPLNLNEQQGLAFSTSFLFDPVCNVIMLESTRNAVGVSAFASFLRANLEIPSFEVAVVINPQEIQRFHEMTSIKSFEVRIARVEAGTLFSSKKNRSIGQILDSADDTNNNLLTYKLTASRGRSLNLSKIKSFVQVFRKVAQPEEVKALKVRGREEDDGPIIPVDFVEQRLKDTITVEKKRLISDFDIQDRYEKMDSVYQKYIYEIRRTYIPQ